MIKSIKNYIKLEEFLTLIYSIYFNFRYLPFSIAQKLPVKIHYKTKVKISKNARLEFPSDMRPFLIKLGYFGHASVPIQNPSYLGIEGTIIFKGLVHIGKGFSIQCSEDAVLVFGNNFKANKNLHITCSKQIKFGENNFLGWSCTIRDSDGHEIDGKNPTEEIKFGNKVWIAAFCDVLKGVKLGNEVVIATHSLVTSKINQYDTNNVVLAGMPAKIIKSDTTWKE